MGIHALVVSSGMSEKTPQKPTQGNVPSCEKEKEGTGG